MKLNVRSLICVVIVVVATGCGGGGGSSASTVIPSASVQWPDRTRGLLGPSSALSVQVTLSDSAGQAVIKGDRSSASTAHTESYASTTKLRAGNYTLAAKFFSGAGESGTLVALANAAVKLSSTGALTNPDGSPLSPIAFTTQIAHVQVMDNQTVTVGQTAQLQASITDSSNVPLALSPGSITWAVVDGSAATVSADGVATGVSLGAITLTATVDGIKSPAASVTSNWSRGTLPANEIIYYRFKSVGEIHAIKPDGTGDTLIATFPVNATSYAMNPNVQGGLIFSWKQQNNQGYGIYLNNAPTIVGATKVIDSSPGYDQIPEVEVSDDGQWVYFIGVTGATEALYRVSIAGGTPTMIDFAIDFDLSPDDNKVVYCKAAPVGTGNLYVSSVTPHSDQTQLTFSTSGVWYQPQWSKDGKTIIYSGYSTGTYPEIDTIPAAGGTPTTVLPVQGYGYLGASLSPDGTMFSVVKGDNQHNYLQVVPLNGGAAQTLVTTNNGSEAIFTPTKWTSTNGRGLLSSRFSASRLDARQVAERLLRGEPTP